MAAAPDSFLDIDPDNLDVCAMEQPKLMRMWGRSLATAEKKAAEAKNQLKLVMAETRDDIRRDPEKYGLAKATVDAVEDAAVMSDRVGAAQQALIQAEYERDLIKSNVISVNDRKSEIENMTRLHGQMYFAAPRVDPMTRERYEEYARRRDAEKVTQALNDKTPATTAKKPKK